MNNGKMRSSLNPLSHNNVDNKPNPSLKGSSRSNERTWTLKGSNLQYENPAQTTQGASSSSISNVLGEQQPRPDSKRLVGLNRPPSNSLLAVVEPEEGKTDYTVIHVIDENKKQQKDFKCSMKILLKHMKYFEKHLKSSESTEDIDISVHCDVNIFEWLLNYIEHEERIEAADDKIKFYDVVEKEGENYKIVQIKRKRPTFEIGNAISILISSEYLKMSKLVEE